MLFVIAHLLSLINSCCNSSTSLSEVTLCFTWWFLHIPSFPKPCKDIQADKDFNPDSSKVTSQKTLRRRQRNKILGWSASVSLYISLRSWREAVLWAGGLDALGFGSVWNPFILWTLSVVIILEINRSIIATIPKYNHSVQIKGQM